MDQSPEVSTPALDGFLEGGLGLSRAAPARAVQILSSAGFFGPRGAPPDPDLLPHRRLVAWRLVRAAASCLGLVAADEALEDALPQGAVGLDAWTGEARPRGGLTAIERSVVPRRAAREFVALAGAPPALPLLPPTCRDREPRERWVAAYSVLAGALNVAATDIGRAGLAGMLDPDAIVHVDLCADGILAVEELLIDEALRLVVQAGERTATDHFRQRYGFARGEARGLVRLARADALRGHSGNVEEDRALMVAQLKDYVGRSRNSLNMADELRALKELARVQGLTRTDPEDLAADFVKVVSAVTRRQEALQAREVPLLPRGDEDIADFEVTSLQERVLESEGVE